MTTIKLDHISQIEGHARLNIKIENNELKNLELEIFEGARFFENILASFRKFVIRSDARFSSAAVSSSVCISWALKKARLPYRHPAAAAMARIPKLKPVK